MLTSSIIHRSEQVRKGARAGFHEQDLGPRGNSMRPFHIQGRLHRPVRIDRRRAFGFDLGEDGIVEVESLVELAEVYGDARIVERLDDGDRLPRAVAGNGVELSAGVKMEGRSRGSSSSMNS
jgi:hypothetical protein